MAKGSAPRRWPSPPTGSVPEPHQTGAWDLAAPSTEVVGFRSSGCLGSDGNLGLGAVIAQRVGSGRFSPATRPRTVRVRASGRVADSSENEVPCRHRNTRSDNSLPGLAFSPQPLQLRVVSFAATTTLTELVRQPGARAVLWRLCRGERERCPHRGCRGDPLLVTRCSSRSHSTRTRSASETIVDQRPVASAD